jgi:hypothetical protein
MEQQFQVAKRALAQTRWVQRAPLPLAVGEVRVRMDACAYTANNITYAAFGDAMQYWAFYPPYDSSDTDWGCIPLWGFGDVVESRCADVAVGERLYGFWPTASHAVLQPVRVSAGGFVDGAPHRAALHAVYNQVTRCAGDPLAGTAPEDVQALLRPLFTTSWLVDDFLADQGFLLPSAGGPVRVLMSSASSKTAYATAAMLRARQGLERIGLTSPRNRDFCQSLGVYDRVLAYEELADMAPHGPAVYVDLAGDAPLRRQVHDHLPGLLHSASIGGTHLDQLGGAGGLPGPRPTLFFAPAQAKKRLSDWGPAVFQHRLLAAWQGFVQLATQGQPTWLQVQRHAAPHELAALHAQVLQGRGDPRLGHVCAWAAF